MKDGEIMGEQHEKNTYITTYIGMDLGLQIKRLSDKTGLSQSMINQFALIKYMKENHPELDEISKHLLEDAEIRLNRRISLSHSTLLMAREGWKSEITKVIVNWITDKKVLPSKELEESWINDGVAHQWSRDYASDAIKSAIQVSKIKVFGDEPIKITQNGVTTTHKREIRRAHSRKAKS